MTQELTVAVLGGGSFGTAIANIIAENGVRTFLWMRDSASAAETQAARENRRYLPGQRLADGLEVTSDLDRAVSGSDLVFVSIPSHSFRAVTRQIAPLLRKEAMVISTAKGIEPKGFTLMSQVLEQELPEHAIGVLSGPNFAKEIVARQQTGTVIASESEALIRQVQSCLRSETFRVYANPDRYGVELGGALKNIYAIVCGMAAALGAGHNTQAMLLTRSLAEMGRFAAAMGANPMTFLGLAGVGDLILTCTSDLSRNYRVGYALGQGQPLEQVIQGLGQVAEGVNTLRQVKQKADELGVYMPLVSGLFAVLFEGEAIADVARKLMLGEQNHDVEYMGAH
ncbi:NAD(P)H-dependent glycerol-3-phosphate dehydrogenase [Marinimicrobium sp. C6131]|uniref:NAD(P)H-dependent glycerol-3-phosphate dehydrogenase n=1 Tax=Marinimicrobium sp. C6131 TaxID=3022676 RepID=UPI00223DCCF4|nr:NAD(P)H-dependent glycerol-3-phosphate dehydrogenase [Marinimicrobium sp. C6131]UZJ45651.1 NAD(P)H-dependent glycerol-3-phosphate dehydrogenase [Marinimicrobium sp. C6131]